MQNLLRDDHRTQLLPFIFTLKRNVLNIPQALVGISETLLITVKDKSMPLHVWVFLRAGLLTQ